jgi:hypothetical protein
MRTTAELEAVREEGRAWAQTVRDELAPVQASYDSMTVTPGAAGDPARAHATVEDYGVGPLLVVSMSEAAASGYCYAFAASPTINVAVSDRMIWTAGVDFGDGRFLAFDMPADTDPATVARVFRGYVEIALAAHSVPPVTA